MSVLAPCPAARSASLRASAAAAASGSSSARPRGELGGEDGELLGLVLRVGLLGQGVVIDLAGRLDHRLRAVHVGWRVERDVQVGVGQQFGHGRGLLLVVADGLVLVRSPALVAIRVARLLQAGEARVGGGPGGQVAGAEGVFGGPGRGLGGVGGGGQRAGGGPRRRHGRVQVGRAVQLGQERLPVPGRPLAGLGGPVQLGLALADQLSQPPVGAGDGPVEVVQGGLVTGMPQLGQFRGLGGQVAGRGAQTGGFGLEGDQVGGDGETRALQPGRQVGDLGVGDAEPRADGLGAVRGPHRLGVGGFLLLPGHPVAAQLAQLGMVQRAAHRARGAVGQGGGQLGAHVVDALPAQPGGLLEEVDVLQLGGQVRLGLAAGLGAGLDQGSRVQGRAVVAVGLGLHRGQPLGGGAGLVALAADAGAPVRGRGGLGPHPGELVGQRGGGRLGRLGGAVLVVGLGGQGAEGVEVAEPGRVLLSLGTESGGGLGGPVPAGRGAIGQGAGLLLGRAGLGEGGGGRSASVTAGITSAARRAASSSRRSASMAEAAWRAGAGARARRPGGAGGRPAAPRRADGPGPLRARPGGGEPARPRRWRGWPPPRPGRRPRLGRAGHHRERRRRRPDRRAGHPARNSGSGQGAEQRPGRCERRTRRCRLGLLDVVRCVPAAAASQSSTARNRSVPNSRCSSLRRSLGVGVQELARTRPAAAARPGRTARRTCPSGRRSRRPPRRPGWTTARQAPPRELLEQDRRLLGGACRRRGAWDAPAPAGG